MAAQLDAANEPHDGPLADAVARQELVERIDRGRRHAVEREEDVPLQKARAGGRAVRLDGRHQHARFLLQAVMVDQLAKERHVLAGEEWRVASLMKRLDMSLSEAEEVVKAGSKLRERFERALWDRASARSHLGDDAGARADLRECWRRFPDGRFADRVAPLLGELP